MLLVCMYIICFMYAVYFVEQYIKKKKKYIYIYIYKLNTKALYPNHGLMMVMINDKIIIWKIIKN